MATGNLGIEIKNKGFLFLGLILFVVGLIAYFYYYVEKYSVVQKYPYQGLGIVLVLAGIVFMALGFLYPLQRTPPLPPPKA